MHLGWSSPDRQAVSYKNSLKEKQTNSQSGMMVHIYSPSTSQKEAGESGVESKPQLQSKFEATLGYMRPTLKNKYIDKNNVSSGISLSISQCTFIYEGLKTATLKHPLA